jgi:DNA-binding NarL/FixJ family response regulator
MQQVAVLPARFSGCQLLGFIGAPVVGGLIGELRAVNPGVAVLVLSASLDPENLERATDAGADEILDKFASPGEILDAIRRIRADK